MGAQVESHETALLPGSHDLLHAVLQDLDICPLCGEIGDLNGNSQVVQVVG